MTMERTELVQKILEQTFKSGESTEIYRAASEVAPKNNS